MLVAGGDGDGFSIGGGHVAHAIRRNIDLTYIVMDNQIYGLTKGQLSPTSPRGLKTASSACGSLEDPVNPLLYVLGYGARFVAQGTPADMPGLAAMIEEAIRFPGFAFVNVQSPCVTYGAGGAAAQGAQGRRCRPLASPRPRPDRPHQGDGRSPRTTGTKLYTGVFYRNPDPPPTYEAEAGRQRQEETSAQARPKDRILEMFRPQ